VKASIPSNFVIAGFIPATQQSLHGWATPIFSVIAGFIPATHGAA
jgi:hypothetical protein